MTTTPAMPELPEPFALSVSVHEGDTPAKTYVECMLYQKHPNEKQHLYTADQMRARDAMWAERLATLQSQPAEVSDEDVWELWLRVCAESDNVSTRVMIANFARAILALRPQAVPMTDEQRRTLVGNYFASAWAKRAAHLLLSDYDKHHGITAPAGQPKE